MLSKPELTMPELTNPELSKPEQSKPEKLKPFKCDKTMLKPKLLAISNQEVSSESEQSSQLSNSMESFG